MQRVVVLLGVALAMLAGAPPVQGGWVIDEVVRGGGRDRHAQRLFLQSNQLKSVSLDAGKPAQAMIMDLEAQTITHVDYVQRAYMTATVKEYAEAMREGLQAASEAMGKDMEEQLKQLPPEQRRQIEAMLRQARENAPRPAPGPRAEECIPNKIDIRSTGKRITVAGFEASGYEIFNNDALDSEVWIAPAITAAREIDPKKLERMVKDMMAAFPKCPPRGQMFGADPVWTLMKDGYPVRSSVTSHGQTTEVTKAESRAIGGAEFHPPAGFARKTLKEMMGGR
jgi:hypothetical protein